MTFAVCILTYNNTFGSRVARQLAGALLCWKNKQVRRIPPVFAAKVI